MMCSGVTSRRLLNIPSQTFLSGDPDYRFEWAVYGDWLLVSYSENDANVCGLGASRPAVEERCNAYVS